MSRDLLFFWPLESCNYTRAGKIRFQMLADSPNANERPALNVARASAYGRGGYSYTLRYMKWSRVGGVVLSSTH